jgi:hypothetical protein
MERTKPVTINEMPVRIANEVKISAKKTRRRVGDMWVIVAKAGIEALAKERVEAAQ